MASPNNLLGLGLPPELSRRIGVDVVSVVAQGNSRASANGTVGHNAIVRVMASNSGSGIVLPSAGGDTTSTTGMLEGDQQTVYNFLSASIVVYAPTGMRFVGDGASTDGATGISVATLRSAIFQLITATTYGVVKGSA